MFDFHLCSIQTRDILQKRYWILRATGFLRHIEYEVENLSFLTVDENEIYLN